MYLAILDRFLHDLVLEHRDRMHQHFRTRRATGDVNVNRDDLVDAWTIA
jgi:hypothetical protein